MLNDAWTCFGVKMNCFGLYQSKASLHTTLISCSMLMECIMSIDALEPPIKRPKKHAGPKSSVSSPLAVGNPNVATDMSLSSPPVPTRACTLSPAPIPASTLLSAATQCLRRHGVLHQLPRCLRRLAHLLCAGATDEGAFLEPGDDEDFCIGDDVGDDETCDDKSVADENDEEIDSDSEAKVVTPDPISEEPNTDEATYSSSQDISKADLRLHTLKGCDAHMEDSIEMSSYQQLN
ncbi:hypothetical protein PC110_g1324 [Phytophthora cactorum]|uniref:Uncharacterized protein n=1 Tax=Phytophthora cactorum TaxID=29920 RepID=A0A329T115_9STRA|nr:hypothetical protein PC111_g2689 [Phytophthora cactorum]RAW42449.1 hypothetical protein PC110_g1324 [Phytophthora cactorum]